jgi:hypothetical protein
MATFAQMAMAGQSQQDRLAFEKAQDREQSRRTRAAKGGGWGRTLGLLGAGFATGGMGLLGGAMLTGLGGLAGRSVGRAITGGRESDAEKDIDALFYQKQQREFGKDIGRYQEGMRERMLTDTARDMFSAYAMGKYKPEIKEFMGGVKEYGLKDTMARTFGTGGEQFAERVTEQGLADNPWLAGASEADDLWARTPDAASKLSTAGIEETNLLNIAGTAAPASQLIQQLLKQQTSDLLPASDDIGVTTQPSPVGTDTEMGAFDPLQRYTMRRILPNQNTQPLIYGNQSNNPYYQQGVNSWNRRYGG